MALSEERKFSLLVYCKLTELADDPEVQELIPVIYASAVEFMAGAGVTEPTEAGRKAMFDLLVNRLVLDAWDRRSTIVEGSAVSENPAYRQMLNQMKLTEPGGSYF